MLNRGRRYSEAESAGPIGARAEDETGRRPGGRTSVTKAGTVGGRSPATVRPPDGTRNGRMVQVFGLAVLALAAGLVIFAAGPFNPSSDQNDASTGQEQAAGIASSPPRRPAAGAVSTPGTQPRTTAATAASERIFSETTGDVLVFDNGFDGVTVIDLDRGTTTHAGVDGQLGGDQPYRIHRVASSLLFGWGEITTFDLETLDSQLLGAATIFVPATEPDRVWMIEFPGGYLSNEEPVVWQVNMTGDAVTETVPLGFSGFPVHGLPDGLAVETRDGVMLWDADSRSVVRQLGRGQGIVADVSSHSIAWCAEPCTQLRISDLAGTFHVQVPAAPTDVPNARFSPDGAYLAVPTPSGADIFEATSGNLVLSSTDGASHQSPRLAGWDDGSEIVYTSTYSYPLSEMTLSRIDLSEATSEAVTLPVGGGLAFVVVPRDEAGVLLAAHRAIPIGDIGAGD